MEGGSIDQMHKNVKLLLYIEAHMKKIQELFYHALRCNKTEENAAPNHSKLLGRRRTKLVWKKSQAT
jgi:hypothetical protein